MLLEFAIACCDEPEVHRKKEGDIIAVVPHPWNWGLIEVKEHLIVIIDGMTFDEGKALILPQMEKTGKVRFDEKMGIEIEETIITSKRQFKIPFQILKDGWMPDLNFDRIRDKRDAYQPFKSQWLTIDSKEKVSLCLDKSKGTFKYMTKKVI